MDLWKVVKMGIKRFLNSLLFIYYQFTKNWKHTQKAKVVVSNHWTGLLDWNNGMDYWTDTFLVFKHVVVVVGLIDSFWL